MNLALFDYGAGNLHSLKKALEAGGASVTITPDWAEALSRDGLVLPGVGSFGAAVRSLAGERERVRDALADGLPCLGICLGMQILFDLSQEGEGEGIGIIPGIVRRIQARVVPQMGWNDVRQRPPREEPGGPGGASGGADSPGPSDPLFLEVGDLVAYFAHSYVCVPRDPGVVIASTEYQGDTFPATVRKGRTWGVQFHPEKSSASGLRLIRNFLQEIG